MVGPFQKDNNRDIYIQIWIYKVKGLGSQYPIIRYAGIG